MCESEERISWEERGGVGGGEGEKERGGEEEECVCVQKLGVENREGSWEIEGDDKRWKGM